MLFGVQIWLSGEIATAGERIKSYEQRKEELLLENARLQEEFNALSSLESISKRADEMGFVKAQPDQIEYVHIVDSLASLSST